MKKATIVLSWTKGEPSVEYCGTDLAKGVKKFDEICKKPANIHCVELIKDGRRKKKRVVSAAGGLGVVHSTASKAEQEKSAKGAEDHAKKEAEAKAAKLAKKQADGESKDEKGK